MVDSGKTFQNFYVSDDPDKLLNKSSRETHDNNASVRQSESSERDVHTPGTLRYTTAMCVDNGFGRVTLPPGLEI